MHIFTTVCIPPYVFMTIHMYTGRRSSSPPPPPVPLASVSIPQLRRLHDTMHAHDLTARECAGEQGTVGQYLYLGKLDA